MLTRARKRAPTPPHPAHVEVRTSSSTMYRPVISPISELAWKSEGLSNTILAEPLVPVRLRSSCTSGTELSATPLKNCIEAASQERSTPRAAGAGGLSGEASAWRAGVPRAWAPGWWGVRGGGGAWWRARA